MSVEHSESLEDEVSTEKLDVLRQERRFPVPPPSAKPVVDPEAVRQELERFLAQREAQREAARRR